MSTTKIHHFIVHEIIRDKTKSARLEERKEENDVDKMAEEVVSSLLGMFNKTGLQTGSFSQDGGKPKFEQTLSKWCKSNEGVFSFENFTQLTVDLSRLLADEMNKGAGKIARPNYIVFFHHTTNENSYLSVITLLITKGFTLKNLSFEHIDKIDLDKLHLGARIRLNDWNDELEERYISFRIGKSSELRDYFKDFIGCKEFTQAKVETKCLVDAIKKCCNDLYHDNPTKINETLELAEKFCKTHKENDGKISLISLGKHLFPDNDDYLLTVCQGDDYKLSERVSIDNGGLRALIRYRGSNKRMSISFDSELLQSGKVVYKNGKLTFNEIPKELKDNLDKGL